MQTHLSLLQDVRGCVKRLDPLTPEIVADQSEDGLTCDELKQIPAECGMDIKKVVFDGSRAFQNAFYADFEQGTLLLDSLPEGESGGDHQYNGAAVSLPMQIYDFERRYRDIKTDGFPLLLVYSFNQYCGDVLSMACYFRIVELFL